MIDAMDRKRSQIGRFLTAWNLQLDGEPWTTPSSELARVRSSGHGACMLTDLTGPHRHCACPQRVPVRAVILPDELPGDHRCRPVDRALRGPR